MEELFPGGDRTDAGAENAEEFITVKRMIRSLGGETPSTYSQTLMGEKSVLLE